ncbi:MAG: hypothetical protein M8841_08920, partial [marine benthic group bacterium]|nr:hypothetical protein [Gemmatimonadota bacterium]
MAGDGNTPTRRGAKKPLRLFAPAKVSRHQTGLPRLYFTRRSTLNSGPALPSLPYVVGSTPVYPI